MICSDCGHNNTETSTFCVICGAQLIKANVFRAGDYSKKPVEKKDQGVVFPAAGIKEETAEGKSIHDDRYVLLEKLGEGGMGRIYLARDTKMDSKVVIKELLPIFITHAEREYLENRFREEAKILFRLDYRGLPKVIDFFCEEKKMYIVMQYVEGENLIQLIKKRPVPLITTDECLLWMTRLLDIMDYLHGQNPPIIHRDIKPKNIMINNRGEIYLVDFGLARTLSSMTKTNTSVGTFGYSSPEHYSGKFELSSDIYSLGATFHHLLSGDDPQHRDTFEYPPLIKYIPDFPPGLQKIFDRMLNMKKSSRFPSVKELKAALDEYKETLVKTMDMDDQKDQSEDFPGMTLDLMEDDDEGASRIYHMPELSQRDSVAGKSRSAGKQSSISKKTTFKPEQHGQTSESASQQPGGEFGKTLPLPSEKMQNFYKEESAKMEKETEFFIDDDDEDDDGNEDRGRPEEIMTLVVEEDDVPESSGKIVEMPIIRAEVETGRESVPPPIKKVSEKISEKAKKTACKPSETLSPKMESGQKKAEAVKVPAKKVSNEKKSAEEPSEVPSGEDGKKKSFPFIILMVAVILGVLSAGVFFGKDLLSGGIAKSSPTISPVSPIDEKPASPALLPIETGTPAPLESPVIEMTPEPAESPDVTEPSPEVSDAPPQQDKGVLLISSGSGAQSVIVYNSSGAQQGGIIRLNPTRTDQPIPLIPGEYSVKFTRAGYYTIMKKGMTIETGEKLEVSKGSLDWVALPSLTVSTDKEAKIEVYDLGAGGKVINKGATAKTPDGKFTFQQNRMQDGTYKVIAKREGHKDASQKVVLKEGGEKKVSLELKPIPKPVYVAPKPVYREPLIYRPAPRVPRDPVSGK